MKEIKTTVAWVRLTEEQAIALAHMVESTAGNRSEHIRQAVEEYLKRHNALPLPQSHHNKERP